MNNFEYDPEKVWMVRTDFSNDELWNELCRTVNSPQNTSAFMVFQTTIECIDDTTYQHWDAQQIIAALPDAYKSSRSYLYIADAKTMSHPSAPILVVDYFDANLQSFRSTPDEIPGVETNLSLANLGVEDFQSALNGEGIFTGFRFKTPDLGDISFE